MARPYSNDLRDRGLGSVERGELSRRQAASHYRVGASRVIRLKKLSGSWRGWLLDRCRAGEFTLRGLVGELAERGLKVDSRSVWEFVHAEKLTHKKRR
jgi:putative transposase